jgi:hypothetical protein
LEPSTTPVGWAPETLVQRPKSGVKAPGERIREATAAPRANNLPPVVLVVSLTQEEEDKNPFHSFLLSTSRLPQHHATSIRFKPQMAQLQVVRFALQPCIYLSCTKQPITIHPEKQHLESGHPFLGKILPLREIGCCT